MLLVKGIAEYIEEDTGGSTTSRQTNQLHVIEGQTLMDRHERRW